MALGPQKFDHSVNPVLLRTLSASSLQSMSRNPSDTTSVDCVRFGDSLDDTNFQATETSTIPRRNLTEAFEELYVKPNTEVDTPLVKQPTNNKFVNMISPTGVADFSNGVARALDEPLSEDESLVTPEKEETTSLPRFALHKDLKRDLSDALVDRISFYAIVHDINKEASTMASNDDSGYNRNPEDLHEEYDPLVVAVNGYPTTPLVPSSSMVNVALIDEERWLLDTIDSRTDDESRSVKACPPTFLQAMGERDYENPLASLSNGSRTQLWKPSRSWWEAKSGKNPWIEPKSHNKRWRYLWPLIHYHKFLAKCIKKLKRNGVDVKTSVSPVSVFLREEVCAVSDHLAAVSLFDSDQWMACLEHFSGWTDTSLRAEENMREHISQLKLRPLVEPGDIDSPLLRSQIDEQYLRAMASARAQMAGTGSENERPTTKEATSTSSNQTPELGSKKNGRSQASTGPPPTYPRQNGSSPSRSGSARVNTGPSPATLRRPRWGYPAQQAHWYGGWHPHAAYHYGDDNSVQSGLSGDSYPQAFDMSMYPGVMHHPPYYHPMMYAHPHPSAMHHGLYDPSMHETVYTAESYGSEHYEGVPWNGQIPPDDVPVEAAVTPSKRTTRQSGETPPRAHSSNSDLGPPTVAMSADGEQTPLKYNPASPYWGHLDHTTLAMMGIATPQGVPSPQTPLRGLPQSPDGPATECGESAMVAPVNAQPLLLRPPYPSYSYYGTHEGYGPPSPATQFMMSPQGNFAYGYAPAYGGFSPNRGSSPQHPSASAHGTRTQRSADSGNVTTSATATVTADKNSDSVKAAKE